MGLAAFNRARRLAAEKASKAPKGSADSGAAKPKAVSIPDDWESLHWKKRAALAADISGKEVSNSDEADAIIVAELEKRTAPDE